LFENPPEVDLPPADKSAFGGKEMRGIIYARTNYI
jgi:hypothetical protein